MIRLIARLRHFAGIVAFWHVNAADQVQDLAPVPPPAPSPITVADVALAKSEGPLISSRELQLQLWGWTGATPPKPWTYRAIENELTHRAKLRATRAAASETPAEVL